MATQQEIDSDPTSELSDFPTVTEKYQRELLAHCYRMSGSVHEAEDLVQETFLRAWKASANFQGRSSVRTWLYRIAPNVCLTNLEGRPRRPLPAGLGTPDQMAGDALEWDHEIAWLEPVPDASVVVAERDSIRRPRGMGGDERINGVVSPEAGAVMVLVPIHAEERQQGIGHEAP